MLERSTVLETCLGKRGGRVAPVAGVVLVLDEGQVIGAVGTDR